MSKRSNVIIIAVLAISIVGVVIFGEYKDNKDSLQILLNNQKLSKTTQTSETTETRDTLNSSIYDKISKKQTISILVLGDAQASSEGVSEENKWTTKVKLWLNEKYGSLADINIVALPGQNVQGALDGYKKLDVKSYDLVLICVGESDIGYTSLDNFKTSYEGLITAIKGDNAGTEIMTMVESSIRLNVVFPQAILDLSSKYNLLGLDVRAEFRKSKLSYAKLTSNGILPSKEGYDIYASTVENSIKSSIDSKRKLTP